MRKILGDGLSTDPMRLLADGVPLSLLLDLALPHGPDSESIAEVEAGHPQRH